MSAAGVWAGLANSAFLADVTDHDRDPVRITATVLGGVFLGLLAAVACWLAVLTPYTIFTGFGGDILMGLARTAHQFADPEAKGRRPKPLAAGDLPSPINPPPGCHFHPRCPFATELCRRESPVLRETSAAGGVPHAVACHYDLIPAAVPSPHGPPQPA